MDTYVYVMPDGNKVKFVFQNPSPTEMYTHCIIETKAKKFFSGVAVVAPHENNLDEKLGMRIALKRACLANPTWNFNVIVEFPFSDPWFEKKRFAPEKYKEYWHFVRIAMKEAKNEQAGN